jgi:peptidyl-dipeptidase Dcp
MNPLLTSWNGPFGLPPFDAIDDAHFAPAFEVGLAEARAQ